MSAAACACMLTLLASAPSLAADPFVQNAEDLMDDAEYARAQKVIDKGLARAELPMPVLRSLYVLEGTCWVSLGENGRARSSFAKLLTLDPGFDGEASLAPKIRTQLQTVRKELTASGDLENVYQVQHRPLGNVVPGGDATVELGFGNQARSGDVARVVVFVRRLGTVDFAALDANRQAGTTTWRARLPAFLLAEDAETYSMEYYVDALSAEDARIAGAGNRALPLSFLVVPLSVSQRELDAGEGDGFPVVPVAIGVGVGVAALIAVGAVVGGVFLLAPRTGSATVTITQASP